MRKEARRQQRDAFERRTWRLGLLLTGDAWGASRTLDLVARAARDLSSIDAVHLDRLIVLHARDVASTPPSKRGRSNDDPPPPEGAGATTLAALMRMKPQAREAWVLSRIDELDEIHVARAMDASKTASGHHLDAADALLDEQFDVPPAIEALRAWADEVDPEPWLIIHRERVKRRRRVRWIAIGSAGVLLGVGVLVVALSLA